MYIDCLVQVWERIYLPEEVTLDEIKKSFDEEGFYFEDGCESEIIFESSTPIKENGKEIYEVYDDNRNLIYESRT